MERQYAPYSKWFGSAFAQLDCADGLSPILSRVLGATNWQDRERNLAAAYEIVAAMHNGLNITEPVPTSVSSFHNRPFMIIQGEAIARSIWEAIQDPEAKSLPYGVGKVDQYVGSTDILSNIERCRRLGALHSG